MVRQLAVVLGVVLTQSQAHEAQSVCESKETCASAAPGKDAALLQKKVRQHISLQKSLPAMVDHEDIDHCTITPCATCEGHCETDDQCGGGRDAGEFCYKLNRGSLVPPGCSENGPSNNVEGHGYCFKPMDTLGTDCPDYSGKWKTNMMWNGNMTDMFCEARQYGKGSCTYRNVFNLGGFYTFPSVRRSFVHGDTFYMENHGVGHITDNDNLIGTYGNAWERVEAFDAMELPHMHDDGEEAGSLEPLQPCEGNCDGDDQCAGGRAESHFCYKLNRGMLVPPGCSDSGALHNVEGHGYCFKPLDTLGTDCPDYSGIWKTTMMWNGNMTDMYCEARQYGEGSCTYTNTFNLGGSYTFPDSRRSFVHGDTFYMENHGVGHITDTDNLIGTYGNHWSRIRGMGLGQPCSTEDA